MSNADDSVSPVRIDVPRAELDPLNAILYDPRAAEQRLRERLQQRRIQAFIEGRRQQLEALWEAWDRRWPEMYSLDLGRNFTDDEHFAEWAGRLKRWGDAVRSCGCRARQALRSWRPPEGLLPDSDERRRAMLAYYVACRAADPKCSAAEIETDLRRTCTQPNAHLLDTLYLPGGWLGKIQYAIDQAVRHPRRQRHARPEQAAIPEQTGPMSGGIALSLGPRFDMLALRLLGIDGLPSPRSDGFEGDPYLTKGDYQRLCNIVCERVPGITAGDWWSLDMEQRIACLEAALDHQSEPAAAARAAALEATSAAPTRTSIGTTQESAGSPTGTPASHHVVILVHGIRTHANWAEMVASKLEETGSIDIIPLRYGYFDVFQFWLPYLFRKRVVDRILREIRTARHRHPHSRISVLAHSFGTYTIGRILQENPDIHLHRLILCGSILPLNFRWDRVSNQVKETVLNECGTRDLWPVLAQSTTWGYGASGTFGFGTVPVRDRYHNAGHSQYFREAFVEEFWSPFIKEGKIKRSEWDATRPPVRWWVSVLSKLPIRYVFVILLIIFVLGLYYSFTRVGPDGDTPPEPPPPPISAAPPDCSKKPSVLKAHSLLVTNHTNRSLRIWHWTKSVEGEDTADEAWGQLPDLSPNGSRMIDLWRGGCHFLTIDDLDAPLATRRVEVGWREFEWEGVSSIAIQDGWKHDPDSKVFTR